MNKLIKVLLACGAVLLSTGTFISCNDDEIDELKSKVAAIETAIDDLKTQLSNALTTGASVVSASQDEKGDWTIKLSDGKEIVINASMGGGSNISVTVTDSEAIIIVDGEEYVLPLGSSVNSLIYSPETVDGIVHMGNDGVIVNFLTRPALTNIDGAKFSIAESHVLTRATDGEQFKVKQEEVVLEGDFIKVPIKALNVEVGNTYAVSLQMNYKGTAIGSNYFNVQISDDFSFKAEDLVEPIFAAEVTDGASLENGFWTATLPDSKADFLGTFNFNDLISLPGVELLTFSLGVMDMQNSNVQGRYDFFKSCLAEDGTWTMQGRPGTNCNKNEEDVNPNGLLIYVKSNDVIKAKIYWKIVDPLAGVDFMGSLKGNCGGHLEYGDPLGTPIIVNPGENKLGLAAMLLGEQFTIQHDGGKLIGALKEWSCEYNGATVIYASGSSFVVDEAFKNKYAKYSQGLNWYNMQTSIAASQRQNWSNYREFTDEEKNKYNGEIISGWDGLPVEDMEAKGLAITKDGYLNTDENYGGWALRIGMGLEFEYDYGKIAISDGVLAYIWFNRRQCAEGVEDPAAR